MKVLITGTSGLIGSALAKSLTAGGHSAISLQRQNNNPDSPVWDPENCVIDLARVGDIYAVVHLAGETLQTVVGAKQRKTVSCTAESEEQNFWSSILPTLIRNLD